MSPTFNNFNTFLVGINMFRVNMKNIGTRCEISLKLTIKTPERRQLAISVFNSYFTPCSSSFKVDFEQANASWVYYRVIACNFAEISSHLQVLFFSFSNETNGL